MGVVVAGVVILGGLVAMKWFKSSNAEVDKIFQESIRDDCHRYLNSRYSGEDVRLAIDETLQSARVAPELVGLLRLECVIEKLGVSDCNRSLQFLFRGQPSADGEASDPVFAKVERSVKWRDLPESIRNEFLANSGTKIIIQLAEARNSK